MAKLISSIILTVSLACLVGTGLGQPERPPPKDVLLLRVIRNRVVAVEEDTAKFVKDITNHVRMVSFVGHVANTNRMMHFVVDRPYQVHGPEQFGVEMWPLFFNISVPLKTTLLAVHYDHDLSGFKGDPFTEAQLVAVMTLISSHMVFNHDQLPSRHPLASWEFLARKRIPPLVLRDIMSKKMPELAPYINWPKLRSYHMSPDDSFAEYCREHEFPEYLWPDLEAMFNTGRYGSKVVSCGGFIKAMTEDTNSFETVLDKKFVDLNKEVHHSATGDNLVKTIRALVNLVNEPAFQKEYNAKMEQLQVVIKKARWHFDNIYGSSQQHLGGPTTAPTPAEPGLPPKREGQSEMYPGITSTEESINHMEL